jgi:hypothetical protein
VRPLTAVTGKRATRGRGERALAVGMCLAAIACGREASPRKRQLAKLPPSFRPGMVAVADDGERWAYVDARAEGQRVVTRKGPSDPYRECYRPMFSPRTGRSYFWTRDGAAETGGIGLVMDGEFVTGGFGRTGKVVFSADGRHWVAVAGTPSQGEDEQLVRGPVVLLADGKEVARHSDMSHPALSMDGAHVAYLAETEPGTVRLMVDGEARRTLEPPADACAAPVKTSRVGPNLHPQFIVHYLADGSLLALLQDRDGWGVYRGDTRLASYLVNKGDERIAPLPLVFGDPCASGTAVVPSTFALATDAPVAAWWERLAGTAERWRVVVDARPADEHLCAAYWDDPTPLLSDDGRHVAYPCTSIDPAHPDHVYVVKDGRRFGPYKDVWGMGFSSDATRLVYDARNLEEHPTWSVYVDGQPLPGQYRGLWRPRFDPRARHVAWEALPLSDPTGRGLLVLDGRQIGVFDEILWGPEFEPGHVSWAFLRGRRLMRLDLPLP